jgi:hypothetical protein
MDTLECLPHNSSMPQLSSAGRLIMAVNGMADALKHPHQDVSFDTVGEYIISAITTLSAIFKRKYNKIPSQHFIDSLLKAVENKCPAL